MYHTNSFPELYVEDSSFIYWILLRSSRNVFILKQMLWKFSEMLGKIPVLQF